MASQTTVQLKRSSVAGKVPDAANIDVGEPVVNLNDKIIFTKDGNGNVIVIGAGTTSNVTEGNKLYFTDARVATALTNQTLSNATFSGHVKANELSSTQSSGDEGGQLNLAIPQTNTTLNGPIAIDIYQDKLRIFETTGTNRGAYLDFTAASSGVGTNLLTGGTGGSGTITNVAGVASGAVSNTQLASGILTSGVLTTANVSELTNLYFTNARSYANVTQLGYITSSSLAGYATNNQLGVYATNTQLNAYALDTDLTTANVTELTNLYYTNARVYANVSPLISKFTYDSTAPTSPQINDEWIDSTSGVRYVYINDGSSSQWVEFGFASNVSSGVSTSGGITTGKAIAMALVFGG